MFGNLNWELGSGIEKLGQRCSMGDQVCRGSRPFQSQRTGTGHIHAVDSPRGGAPHGSQGRRTASSGGASGARAPSSPPLEAAPAQPP